MPFAGYEMPIQYEKGPVEEHLLCRRSVGLFDIDHMGQVEVSGSGALAFVSKIVSCDVASMKEWDAKYSLLLNEKGTVIDDLFIYRLKDSFWIVVNASNREADLAWFHKHKTQDVVIVDHSDPVYMIAVQGPRAIELMDLVSSEKISDFPRFTSGRVMISGVSCLVGRTGYTGEDGVELFFPAEKAVEIWEHLLKTGSMQGIETAPIGLAARDSLRFEAGMPLHGHEISTDINAIEACFKWACDFTKDFIGKAALEKIVAEGSTRKLVVMEVTGGVPREHYDIVNAEGVKVGETVAGMFCPSVKKFACNAFVRSDLSKIGTKLFVVIHNKNKEAVVVKKPLYLPTYRR